MEALKRSRKDADVGARSGRTQWAHAVGRPQPQAGRRTLVRQAPSHLPCFEKRAGEMPVQDLKARDNTAASE
jgi:hypothetical protein